MPENSGSVLFYQRLSEALQFSIGYYVRSRVRITDLSSGFPPESPMRRVDMRIARSFGQKEKAGGGEVAAVVQNAFQDDYTEYTATYRSVWVSCSNGVPILLRPFTFNRTALHRSISTLSGRLLFLPLGCLLLCVPQVQADALRVAVVLSEEGGAYLAFSESLRSKLPADRFVLTTQRADDALGEADLYLAVGMKAASRLASTDAPTLNVLVPKAGYDKLLHSEPQHTSPRSAVFLDQPMERQLALLLVALPDTHDVGVLYANPPPELKNVRHLLASRNIHLHERAVDEKHPLNDALDSILSESNVLFVLADADVYNASTIRNILLTAYRKQVPLVGISQAFVKAGALCAVFTTPEQFAEQVAAMVRRYGETQRLPAAQYPSEFEVLVNTQVARSLDLRIKDAYQLRDEIRGAP